MCENGFSDGCELRLFGNFPYGKQSIVNSSVIKDDALHILRKLQAAMYFEGEGGLKIYLK